MKVGRTLPVQGGLNIWMENSTLFLLKSKPFEVALPKFQHILYACAALTQVKKHQCIVNQTFFITQTGLTTFKNEKFHH